MTYQDDNDGGIRAWAEQGAAEEALFDSLPTDIDDYADAATAASTTQIAEYNRTAAALAGLRGRLAGVVYDVTTTAGMAAAKKDRAEVRDLLTGLEKERVRIKSPALERCRLIDAEAKTITAELESLKKPIDEQINVEVQRKANEKQAKINAEFARVEAIQTAIHELHMDAVVTGKPSAFIAERLAKVQASALDPLVYQEQMPQAQLARQQVIDKLSTSLMAAKFAEAEAAKLAAERAELEQLREMQRQQKAKDEAAAAELRKAEDARRAAELAAQRAEQARIAAEQRAAQDALDAQAAELKRQQDAIAAQAAAAAEAERIKREAEERADILSRIGNVDDIQKPAGTVVDAEFLEVGEAKAPMAETDPRYIKPLEKAEEPSPPLDSDGGVSIYKVMRPFFILMLTKRVASALVTLSENHYDSRCQLAGREGGFLYGWRNHFVEFELDSPVETSPRELDTLMKIMELPAELLLTDDFDTLDKLSSLKGLIRHAMREAGVWA